MYLPLAKGNQVVKSVHTSCTSFLPSHGSTATSSSRSTAIAAISAHGGWAPFAASWWSRTISWCSLARTINAQAKAWAACHSFRACSALQQNKHSHFWRLKRPQKLFSKHWLYSKQCIHLTPLGSKQSEQHYPEDFIHADLLNTLILPHYLSFHILYKRNISK